MASTTSAPGARTGRPAHPGLRVRRPHRRPLRAARPLTSPSRRPSASRGDVRASASSDEPRSSSTTATARCGRRGCGGSARLRLRRRRGARRRPRRAGRASSRTRPRPRTRPLHAAPQPRKIADRAEIENGPACLINALGPAAFEAARIPGSTSLPSRDLLDPDSGRFRSEDELRERLGAAGALGGGRVVTYCGGGISATLDAFALTLLGEPDVAVYDGSMGEWTADPSLPMERG